MKSSTLRRSNITREKMAMLSALSEYNNAKGRSNSHITDKQAELDMLWQNFKIAATSERSPKTYFSAGFFTGIVVSLLAATLISFCVGYSPLNDIKFSAPKSAKENVKFTFIPADKQVQQEEVVSPAEKEYTVQAGDSLEDISMRFYGSFDEAKLKEIQVKNNLKDLNSIKIGQKLIIPMSQN
ncbi:MAG: LysM peptidoglycan-binding domain-containing protein [Candidatus Gastranaerophilales bacterium]|nr:LysM peptidoglycan-binding domain-containing protein [Candidatus Gastranaerophilales bacterium]